MDGTGVSGSSSGQAVGFDPGGLSHLQSKSGLCEIQIRPLGVKRGQHRPSSSIKPPAATSPMLQEVFNLDEGPVTLAFPSALSEEERPSRSRP
jgi:hypothetical protein